MSKLLQLAKHDLEVRNFNNDFLLIKASNNAPLAKLGKAIFERKFDFVEEVIVTEVEICLKLNQNFAEAKIALLNDIEIENEATQKHFKLPVFFAPHEDWNGVKAVTGFSKNEVIEKLEKIEFSVAMFGFIPGFVYFNGLDAALHVPRKAVPAKYLEANSLAIGGKYLGLYSLPSPGGWHVIGKLPISLLNIPELPPVGLDLGDKIQLQAISEKEFEDLKQQQISIMEFGVTQ